MEIVVYDDYFENSTILEHAQWGPPDHHPYKSL
jgi:hypothetical protein